jgi:hypothetical protein
MWAFSKKLPIEIKIGNCYWQLLLATIIWQLLLATVIGNCYCKKLPIEIKIGNCYWQLLLQLLLFTVIKQDTPYFYLLIHLTLFIKP